MLSHGLSGGVGDLLHPSGQIPYSHVFLRPFGELQKVTAPFDTVMYERGFRMTPRPGAQVLCGVVEPYFERTYERFSGHSYTPAAP